MLLTERSQARQNCTSAGPTRGHGEGLALKITCRGWSQSTAEQASPMGSPRTVLGMSSASSICCGAPRPAQQKRSCELIDLTSTALLSPQVSVGERNSVAVKALCGLGLWGACVYSPSGLQGPAHLRLPIPRAVSPLNAWVLWLLPLVPQVPRGSEKRSRRPTHFLPGLVVFLLLSRLIPSIFISQKKKCRWATNIQKHARYHQPLGKCTPGSQCDILMPIFNKAEGYKCC